MKAAMAFRTTLVALAFVLAGQTGTRAADAPKFEQYKNIIDVQAMAELAVVPVRDDVMVVDSRPAKIYDEGHIPGAVSIPNTFFPKLTGMLPKDKAHALVFYCGGLACPLSHKSAFKAEKLGYTNIKVFAAGFPAWVKAGHLASISAKQVKKMIDAKAPVTLIDARPSRVAKAGMVPGAINIPDTFFAKMTAKLPADKAAELVFYCGGVKCPLSPKSAAKAIKLGYTNVKLFQEGYPAWKAAYGDAGAAVADSGSSMVNGAKAAALVIGPSGDTVDLASFKKVLAEAPDSIQVVDVRDPGEFAAGTIKGSHNIPVDKMFDRFGEVAKDKPVVFVCATGTRAAEAYDIAKMENADAKVYFLDAHVTYNGDGSFDAKPNK